MNSQDPSSELTMRQLAEARLSEKQRSLPRSERGQQSAEERQRDLHELQVHQIELEMQNEELRRAQLLLDAARARYFDLYDLAPVAYFTLSDKGLIQEVNLTTLTLLAATKGELVARPLSPFILKEDQDRYYHYRKELLRDGNPPPCPLRMVKTDGTIIWVQLTARTSHDAAGITAYHVTLSDITARKHAEAAVVEGAASLRAFFNSSGTLCGIVEVLKDDILHLIDNDPAALFFGRTAAEMVNQRASELGVPPETIRLWRTRYAESERTGRPVSFEYHHGQGSDSRDFRVTVSHLFRGLCGPRHAYVIEDITARRQAETELRLQSSALRAAANAIVITDPTGSVVWANPAFTSLTGYAISEVLGQNPRFLKSGEHDAAFYRQLWETIRAGQVWSGELINKRKDGSRYTEEMTVTPVRTEQGEISHFIAIKQDITRRKQAEQALEASNRQLVAAAAELGLAQQQVVQQASLRALGQMASGIAHDFNNALSPIVGFSELLLKHPEVLADQEKLVRFLRIINTAGRDASDVVRRLREFGHQRKDGEISEAIDLAGLILHTIELTQPRWKDQAQATGLTIQLATDLRKVPPIAGEESAIREILTNLIFNAVDALPAGGTITLGTELDGEFAKVWVRDNGAGMTEEVRLRCFEPFFTTKGKHGTGLGLSMVHGIVQRHGGTVAIVSAPGQGTTISIRLPLLRTASAPLPLAVSAPLARSLRVLVVDDEPILRSLVEAYLTCDGHAVVTASSAALALPLLKTGQFDLVLTDKAMPEMNGEQLAVAIHECRPGLPVILMSGFGDLMKAAGEMPPHIRALLSKPITETSLRDALAKVFPG